jgi:hypothetical protein
MYFVLELRVQFLRQMLEGYPVKTPLNHCIAARAIMYAVMGTRQSFRLSGVPNRFTPSSSQMEMYVLIYGDETPTYVVSYTEF